MAWWGRTDSGGTYGHHDVIYALKRGPKFEKRYLKHFRNPDILRFDMQHKVWIFQKEWKQTIV